MPEQHSYKALETGSDHSAYENICQIAMESMGMAALITDQFGNILYVNEAFESITGYSAKEAIGKTPAILRSGRQSKIFYEHMWRNLQNKGEWEGTLWNKKKNGEMFHERLSIRRLSTPTGETCYVGVFSDISEQDELQQALISAQKRELMAVMTGSVAHNFNNYMAAIRGYAELGQQLPMTEKARRYFSEILSATEKATSLVKEMLSISHTDPPTNTRCDLGNTVRQAIHTAHSILPNSIDLVSQLPNDTAYEIIGSGSDIEQTILNLVANARDALNGKQNARIKISMISPESRDKCTEYCSCTEDCPVRAQRNVILKVKDNGSGIPEDIQEKVFSPFFTTKTADKGSGLGLASANQVISRLGGTIWFNSSENEGSCFFICLPLLEDAATNINAQPQLPLMHNQHSPTLKLLDSLNDSGSKI